MLAQTVELHAGCSFQTVTLGEGIGNLHAGTSNFVIKVNEKSPNFPDEFDKIQHELLSTGMSAHSNSPELLTSRLKPLRNMAFSSRCISLHFCIVYKTKSSVSIHSLTTF
jgi:hypothetical protein